MMMIIYSCIAYLEADDTRDSSVAFHGVEKVKESGSQGPGLLPLARDIVAFPEHQEIVIQGVRGLDKRG